jgi:hypothetical protein
MSRKLHAAIVAAALSLVFGSGSALADQVSSDWLVIPSDTSATIQLGPNLYEITTQEPEIIRTYQALHDTGTFLFVRGLSYEAMRVLEELGDFAVSKNDGQVAADAYRDAAWVANAVAREMPSVGLPFEFGKSTARTQRGHELTAEAERLLKKAEDAEKAG